MFDSIDALYHCTGETVYSQMGGILLHLLNGRKWCISLTIACVSSVHNVVSKSTKQGQTTFLSFVLFEHSKELSNIFTFYEKCKLSPVCARNVNLYCEELFLITQVKLYKLWMKLKYFSNSGEFVMIYKKNLLQFYVHHYFLFMK